MDDFENAKVRRLRAPTTLFERRVAKGLCPQCAKHVTAGQLYCGSACSQLHEAHAAPVAEEKDEGRRG